MAVVVKSKEEQEGMRLAGINDKVENYGRLFREH